jgi:uncharacterized membrane protein
MTAETLGAPPRARIRWKPVQIFAALGCGSVFLFSLAALSAVLIGRAQLPSAFGNWAVGVHLAIIMSALPLSVMQFALPKGTGLHRTTGYIWCALLFAASLVSFGIHELNGGLSPPHYVAISSFILLPTIVVLARKHMHAWHRGVVLGYVLFFLVFAGLFTFIPNRAMGHLLASLWS